MAMLRPKNKASKIAENVMKRKGIKIKANPKQIDRVPLTGPYLER